VIEMQDSTEGWFSEHTLAAGAVRSRQSALAELMQATKKLVLVDQFDREFKQLQRPAATVAKADHSL